MKAVNDKGMSSCVHHIYLIHGNATSCTLKCHVQRAKQSKLGSLLRLRIVENTTTQSKLSI